MRICVRGSNDVKYSWGTKIKRQNKKNREESRFFNLQKKIILFLLEKIQFPIDLFLEFFEFLLSRKHDRVIDITHGSLA